MTRNSYLANTPRTLLTASGLLSELWGTCFHLELINARISANYTHHKNDCPSNLSLISKGNLGRLLYLLGLSFPNDRTNLVKLSDNVLSGDGTFRN